MGYLEWSNEKKVSWSNVLLIQIWWNPEIDQKGQNNDTFFVKFETTPRTVTHFNLIHWKWRLIKVSLKHSVSTYFKTKEGLCVKDQSEIFKRWSIINFGRLSPNFIRHYELVSNWSKRPKQWYFLCKVWNYLHAGGSPGLAAIILPVFQPPHTLETFLSSPHLCFICISVKVSLTEHMCLYLYFKD